MRPKTSRELRLRQASGPSPRRSITPGRKPSMTTSAPSIKRCTVATPSGFLRSTAIDRRPRLRTFALWPLPLCASRSTRMTSAPISDSIIAQKGPGPIPAISITLIPLSGPIVTPAPCVLLFCHSLFSGLLPESSLDRSGELPDQSGQLGQTTPP